MSSRLIVSYVFLGWLVLSCRNTVFCRNRRASSTPARHERRSEGLAIKTFIDQTSSGVVDINWQEYFRLNPDLQEQGLSSPEDARTHYR